MVRASRVTLPPKVEGPNKGALTLRLGPLAWEPALDPGNVVVAVKWWGDDGPGDQLEPSAAVGAAIQFRLVSGPKYVGRYLQDMGSLVLAFKQHVLRAAGSRSSVESAIVGTASVDLRPLGAAVPMACTVPIVAEQGRPIGSVLVSMSLAFSSPAVSSFEINEHVAATEAAAAVAVAAAEQSAAMPLYPTLNPAQQGSVAEDRSAVDGDCGLRSLATFRQLQDAIAGAAWEEALARLGRDQGSVLSGADIEQLVRQLMPGAPEDAISYAAAVLNLAQPVDDSQEQQEGLILGMLENAIREAARQERSMQDDAGAVARRLAGLAQLLSSRHLELAKAFGREEEIGYPQLVSMLRALGPGVSPYELHGILAVLAGLDGEAGNGKVTLAKLKQAILAISYAQAYPTDEEVRRQQQAVAARREKAAAAAAAVAADQQPAPSDQRRQLAVGRLRSTLEEGRQGRGRPIVRDPNGGAKGHAAAHFAVLQPQPGAAAVVGTSAAAGAEGSLPDASLTQVTQQDSNLSHAAEARLPTQHGAAGMAGAAAGAAVGSAVQHTAPSSAPLPVAQLSGLISGSMEQGSFVMGVPVAMSVPAPLCAPPQLALQQPLQPQPPQQQQLGQLAPQAIALGIPAQAQPQPVQQLWQLAPSDPLQTLISRAENLRQAMSHAALQPPQSLLSGPPAGRSLGAAFVQLPGGLAAGQDAGVAAPPIGTGAQLGSLPGLPLQGPPLPAETVAAGLLGANSGSAPLGPAAAAGLPVAHPSLAALGSASVGVGGASAAGLGGCASTLAGLWEPAARGSGSGPEDRLSAASAALIEAARALTRPQQAQSRAHERSAHDPGAALPPVAESTARGPRQAGVAAAEEGPRSSSGGGSSVLTAAVAAGVAVTAREPGTGPAAVDATSALSWDDPAELAEDVILEELFFSRPAQPMPVCSTPALGSPAFGAIGQKERLPAGSAAVGATASQQQRRLGESMELAPGPAVPELVLTLRLATLRLLRQRASAGRTSSGPAADAAPALASRSTRVRGVVKPLHPSAQPVPFSILAASSSDGPARQGSADRSAAMAAPFRGPGDAASMVEVEVAVPAACVEQGRLPPTLFVEVWDQANKLVGIVRAPLSHCHLPAAPSGDRSSGAELPAVVCEGRWDVWNILEGRAEGSMGVFGVVQEKGQPRVVPAVRHGFSVTIQTAYRLPGNAAYAEAELRGPDARYIKYTFPGEPEPLYTKDVPVMSNPTFDATAHHSITLLPDQDISAMLATGGGRLRFEVWDQWVEGKQELHAWAEMPLAELASLVRAATAGAPAPASAMEVEECADADPVWGAAASQSRLLPLITEYDSGVAGLSHAAATAASAKSLALRVDLAYQAEHVLVPAPAPAATEADAGVAGRRGSGTQAAGREMPLPAAGRDQQEQYRGDSGPGGRQHRRQQQARRAVGARETALAPFRPNEVENQRRASAALARAPGAADPAATCEPRGTHFEAERWEEDLEEEEDGAAENNVLLANCSPTRPVKATVPAAAKGIEAVLCVEIIRACGLAAAVREACAFTSGNTALNRARQVGAHPFARLALFPSDAVLQKRAPPLQTPFQAQTFCPEFRARHEYRLRLDARMLQALAEQDLLVELWHHLPRTQAVAAALSAGRSSMAAAGPEAGGLREREVFLGATSGPLVDVLRRPQGFRGWLGLKSRRGEAVGAVQVAVHFSELQGQPVFASAPDRSPLQQCGGLPDILPSHLGWLLRGPEAEAFQGQQATATVAIEEVTPPQEDPSGGRDGDRPKAELYFASYRLPGAPSGHSTTAKTLTAGAGKAAAAAGLAGRAWSAKLGHVGSFQMTAGPALRKALASFPLAVIVYKQPMAAGKAGRAAAAAPPAPVYVGTAEVDLSGLLWSSRQPSDPGLRTISGNFLLVDPSARALGNARVRVRVTLDLSQPCALGSRPGRAADAAAPPGADAVEGLWEVEGEEGPAQQPLLRGQEQPCGCGEKEEEEDEECPPPGHSEPHSRAAPAEKALPGAAASSTSSPAQGTCPASPAGEVPGSCSSKPAAPLDVAGLERQAGDRRVIGGSPGLDTAGGAAARCSATPAPPAPLPILPRPSPSNAARSQPQSQPAARLPSAAAAAAHSPAAAGERNSSGAGDRGSVAGGGSRQGTGSSPAAPSSSLQQGGGGSSSSQAPASSPFSSQSHGPEVASQEPPPASSSGKLLISIESAVHLPSSRPGSPAALRRSGSPEGGGGGGNGGPGGNSDGSGEYSAYVSLTWGPQKLKHSTAAVAVRGLRSPSGGSAAWGETIAVAADAAMFGAGALGALQAGVQPPAPGGFPGRRGAAGGLILLLNVWSCQAAPGGASATVLGSRAASPLAAVAGQSGPGRGHVLIGCAAVDLATLPLLWEVRGYWNVVDYLQQVKGQLLVSVRPDDALMAQLQSARAHRAASPAPGAPGAPAAAAGPELPADAAIEALAGLRQGDACGLAVPRQEEPQLAAAGPAAELGLSSPAGRTAAWARGSSESQASAPAEGNTAAGLGPTGGGPRVPASSTGMDAAVPPAAGRSCAAAAGAAAAAAAGDDGSPGDREPLGEQAADALLGELQARMQALQLLSQRLSREGTAEAQCADNGSRGSGDSSAAGDVERAGGGCAASRSCSRRGSVGDGAVEGEEWLPERDSLRASAGVRIRTVEVSDEEDEGEGLLARLRHNARGRTAWSESDSDDDMALLGVAVEGAVSGAESEEEPQREPERPRRPALMLDDWMFDISITSQPSSEQQQQQQGEGSQDIARSSPRFSGFQNVLLPNVPSAPQPADAARPHGGEEQPQGQERQSGPCPGSAQGGTAAGGEPWGWEVPVELSSSQRPLPVLPQSPPSARPAPTAVCAQQRGMLLGLGVGFSAGGPHDSWLFDITKPALPAAGSGPGQAAEGAEATSDVAGHTAAAGPPSSQALQPPALPASLHQYLGLHSRRPSLPIGGASSGGSSHDAEDKPSS